MSGTNFYDIPVSELSDLAPGSEVRLDADIRVTVNEVLRRSRQLSVTTDVGGHMRVGFDAVEEIL